MGASKREAARLHSLVALLEQQVEALKDELNDEKRASAESVVFSELRTKHETEAREKLERELQLEKSTTTLLTSEREMLALIVQRQQEIHRANLMDAQLEVNLRRMGAPAMRRNDSAIRSAERDVE